MNKKYIFCVLGFAAIVLPIAVFTAIAPSPSPMPPSPLYQGCTTSGTPVSQCQYDQNKNCVDYTLEDVRQINASIPVGDVKAWAAGIAQNFSDCNKYDLETQWSNESCADKECDIYLANQATTLSNLKSGIIPECFKKYRDRVLAPGHAMTVIQYTKLSKSYWKTSYGQGGPNGAPKDTWIYSIREPQGWNGFSCGWTSTENPPKTVPDFCLKAVQQHFENFSGAESHNETPTIKIASGQPDLIPPQQASYTYWEAFHNGCYNNLKRRKRI